MELLDLPKLYAASDYLTLHVAATPETQGMLSREAFAQMKDGVRIVNCARGELVDEAALAEALDSGKVADASLDVFSVEPPPADFPLFAVDGVLATPHIGGSTEEAQEIVGVRIAEQVVEYLKHGVAINAVNMPALSPDSIARWARTRRWPIGWAISRRIWRAAIRTRCGCTTSARSPTSTPACCGMRGWRACWPLDLAAGEPDQRHADRGAARLERGGAAR